MSPEHVELVRDLSDAGREAVERGLVIGTGGNISARLPGGDEYVVTGTGTRLDRLGADDFSVIGMDGARRSGPSPSVEWRLHLQTYAARPDVNAVIHLHPQAAVLLDGMGIEIRLITLDHAYYLRQVARVPFQPAGSRELADACSAAAKEANLIVMAFHGATALGDTVAMGLRRAFLLDEAARNTITCLQLGNRDLTFPTEWLARIQNA